MIAEELRIKLSINYLHFERIITTQQATQLHQNPIIMRSMSILFQFYLAVQIQMLMLSITEAFAPSTSISSSSMNHQSQRYKQKAPALNLKDDDMSEEEREIAIDKALKAMTSFSNKYINNTNTKYCSDLSIPAVVIKGLAEHKVTLGAPLCPCRYYEDKEKEAKDGFWNCP
jgi:hypothetical protein